MIRIVSIVELVNSPILMKLIKPMMMMMMMMKTQIIYLMMMIF